MMISRYTLTGLKLALLTFVVSELGQASDSEAGRLAYNQCIGCHSFDHHRTGPKHCNLVGRIAGTAADFDYSEAMLTSRIVWNQQTLDEFLESPMTYVPGTSMGYIGIQDPEQRAILIDYLVGRSESRQCKLLRVSDND